MLTLTWCQCKTKQTQGRLKENEAKNIWVSGKGDRGKKKNLRWLRTGMVRTEFNINHGKIFLLQFPPLSMGKFFPVSRLRLTLSPSPINCKLIIRNMICWNIGSLGIFLLPSYQPIPSRPPTPPCKWLPRLQDSSKILEQELKEKEKQEEREGGAAPPSQWCSTHHLVED